MRDRNFGADPIDDLFVAGRIDALVANVTDGFAPLTKHESAPFYGKNLSEVIGGPEAVAELAQAFGRFAPAVRASPTSTGLDLHFR